MTLAASERFRPWAVLLVKGFPRAKTRLAGALSVEARRGLARRLFERALGACVQSTGLCGVLVATDGEEAARTATRLGAAVIRDASLAQPLAVTADAALAWLAKHDATHAVLLVSDLPWIGARDLDELLIYLREHDVVLAPDTERRGTNALALRLGLGFRTGFGHPDSLMRHLREAERLQARRYVLHSPRIAFDLDRPADLLRL